MINQNETQAIEELAKEIWRIQDYGVMVVGGVTYTLDEKEVAEKLYEEGYRKQIEGEWIYKFTLDGDRFFECSVCGRQEIVNCLCNQERNLSEDRPYCHCGAHMRG